MKRQINKNLAHLVQSYKSKKSGTVLIGSSRSGKTWSSIDFIIFLCYVVHNDKKCTINIVRDVYASFKTTLYEDFNNRLPDYGITSPFADVKEVPSFWLNGCKINLLGADKPSRFLGASSDYVFFNEAIPNIEKSVFDQAEQRCRIFWWIDSNPSENIHWVLNLNQRDDVSFLKTTFRDNPGISKQEKNKILGYDPSNIDNVRQGTANEYMWKVYGLGEAAEREGLIFKTWVEGEFNDDLFSVWGIDYGYSNDPTALIRTAYDKKTNKLYLKEYLYQTELNREMIGNFILENVPKGDLIMAERDGRLNDELYNMGINIISAEKGPESIKRGITEMLKMHIIAHPQSYNLHNELRNYCWHDKKINTPIDRYNHLIDATRYALEDLGYNRDFFVG